MKAVTRNPPHLVAHRGFMKAFPENTRLSITKAIQLGACFVEFDVQSTQDHQLVVMHDDTLDRTTDGCGWLFDLTLADLQHYSAHEPERFGEKFSSEPLVTLKQMMDTLEQANSVHAFVEIKEESLEYFGHEKIMLHLFDELTPYRDRCTIISFDEEAITLARRKAWPAGWVLHHFDDVHHRQALRLDPDYLICNYKKVKATDAPWRGPWEWMLYDITDAGLALDFAQRGFKFIETEDIGGLMQNPLLRQKACDLG